MVGFLFLQKQVTVDNQLDQILHAIVPRMQTRAFLSQEFELAVVESASGRVARDVLEETERYLIETILHQMSLQPPQSVDGRAVGQLATGVDRGVRPEQTGRVVLLERQAPGINVGMTV